jgi:DNA-binding GntR family transcriptional regulator
MSVLQAEGKIRLVGNRYIVSYPHMRFPGLVKDFGKYLEGQGFTPVMENLIEPREEEMPPEVATLFKQKAGIHVVHRIRKQSMRKEGDPDYPLRIAENWYPSHLALPFLTEMRTNDYIHVVEAIKDKFGVTIIQVQEDVTGRIPTKQEREWLSVSRYQPVLELIWTNFDKDDQPVMFNRIVMVASNFVLNRNYPIDYWS